MHLIALQWDLLPLDPQSNMQKLKDLVATAVPEPGDLLVLPELWPTGYGNRAALLGLTKKMAPVWQILLAELASEHQMYVIGGSVPALEKDRLYNRLCVYGPTGDQIGQYDKIHLFPPMNEQQLFSPGETPEPIPLGKGLPVVGPTICYDLRFPELFRHLARRGATLFVLPAEFPDPKEDLWQIFLAARAAENQAYLVACNRTGKAGSFTFFGSSAVYDPEGQCLGRLGRDEGFLKVEIDLSLVQEARRRLPVLSHCRLHLAMDR